MAADLAGRWGVARAYLDWASVRRRSRAAVVREVLAAMAATEPEPPASPVLAVFQDEALALRGRLELEDGGSRDLDGDLPASIAPGYHSLETAAGERLLIVAPARCVPAPRGWGWAVQLYSLRSRESGGIGDLADLRRLAAWAVGLGAVMLQVSPLHAALPGAPQQPSPYFPSSRRYRNPIHLRVDGLPGGLNDAPLIDRDRVYAAKLEALERRWRDCPTGPGLREYQAREGDALRAFATFTALYEHHGPGWRGWPGGHHRPGSAGTRRFTEEHAARVDFHIWLQWQLDQQLAAAGEPLPLVNDLAVGFDPDGADAWAWQDVIAPGVTVGAPPDEFNTAGQSWGLPPFDPWKLRAARYAPFIETVRAAARHAGGLRIDHVMGLFRLWWIPPGRGPAEGAYVRYPARDLMAILALESARAGAFVVGEDLGTVAPSVRVQLRRRGVLSYRLLWFEQRSPATYPELALAAVTTHDLPTIRGLWTGHDLAAQHELGLEANDASTGEIVQSLRRLTGLPRGADPAEVTLATYSALARAPSRLLAATLEDAAGQDERPNLPGTLDERPNWRIPLPLTLEELEAAELPRQIAAVLGVRG